MEVLHSTSPSGPDALPRQEGTPQENAWAAEAVPALPCGKSRSEQGVPVKDGHDSLALLVGDRAERDGGKAVPDPDGSARGPEGEPRLVGGST